MPLQRLLNNPLAASKGMQRLMASKGGGSVPRPNVPAKQIASKQAAAMKGGRVSTIGKGSIPPGSIAKPRRKKPNANALKEIRYEQRVSHICYAMKKAPFRRIVREIANLLCDTNTGFGIRFQEDALLAIQDATEAFLIEYLGNANVIAHHAKRVTLQMEDLKTIRRLMYDALKKILAEN